MNLWKSLTGQIRCSITSADPAKALNAIDLAGIPLSDIQTDGKLTIRFIISRRDLPRLEKLMHSRGESLEILQQMGLYWKIRSLARRPVMLLGLTLLLWLSLWTPGRVFFIFVEGNQVVPTNQILEQAQICGMGFGASRRSLRSEQVKNHLLQQIPQLTWAGVNSYGCVAVISVTEGLPQQAPNTFDGIYSMVASIDGIIRNMTITAGKALCVPGQAVTAGQTLISGYTDCGICIRADSAQGEVFADTRRNLSAIFPVEFSQRGKIIGETQKYSLIIGKKRIFFQNNSGISSGECVRIYSENYVTLPGGFVLPVAIATERTMHYESTTESYADPEAVLQPFIESYLQSQMIAGRILTRAETLVITQNVARLDGIYGCFEMIGILRQEECLPNYENNGTRRECRAGGRPDGCLWFL